ncbi:hypothetical protein Cgig2_024241 [Carnegiea gigantea]|uniref:Reverse transcriptase zinc-binding domain-containing protein n=1 Tax=Carnegiea gigantea TaxID=171969 RepID=A0A9Q1JZS5_9CARY|nr:hypothetical protein Cgig2_024241 [Carnegiea gigantea]
MADLIVHDLIDYESACWRANLVCQIFLAYNADLILTSRLFGWRATTGVLLCAVAIAKRVSRFSMSCSICGHIEETDTHTILECPLASQIWHNYCFDCNLWASLFHALADCLGNARKSLDEDLFGDFLVVMWECWNARNRFIFKNPDHNLSSLGKGVIDFVHSYRHTLDSESSPQPTTHKSTWSPPTPGYLKLNFDGASGAGALSFIVTAVMCFCWS